MSTEPQAQPLAPAPAESPVGADTACVHCGEPCGRDPVVREGRAFCCAGCSTVYDILHSSGMGRFYDLEAGAGVRPGSAVTTEAYAYLDREDMQRRMLDFSDGTHARVTFRIPSMHCVACVWLLENLYRLEPDVTQSRVHFPRRELAVRFRIDRLPLSALVARLASLGYAPELSLASLEERHADRSRHALTTRIGVAGFAFANTMLLSFPSYFGLRAVDDAGLQHIFSAISLVLSVPVLLYCASDYWRSAWRGLRQRVVTIDLPITLGIIALYAESLAQIFSGAGEGYLDSFTGLIFFLLLGRWFQQRTYAALSFERDYRTYFPLSVRRLEGARETPVPVTALAVGDRIRVRNDELIPCDAILRHGAARIDFSFVTGEAEPVACARDAYVYAGGRQRGGAIELEVAKPVDQGYLVSLWDDDAFESPRDGRFRTLTNRVSGYFTVGVVGIAAAAALFWWHHDADVAVRAFVAVLIVACPCAIALAAPFAEGTALRLMARRGIFLRNAELVEALPRIDTVVFDKTGTLTRPGARPARFEGQALAAEEGAAVHDVALQSPHPHAIAVCAALEDGGAHSTTAGSQRSPLQDTADAERPPASPGGRSAATPRPDADGSVAGFEETTGAGVVGRAHGHDVRLGAATFLASAGIDVPEPQTPTEGSTVHVALDGRYRGAFHVPPAYRPRVPELVRRLARTHRLAVLSGDNEQEAERLRAWFGPDAALHFRQSPHDKLAHIRALQEAGHRVMMIGDGLNDAGALRQSDVGVAVTEDAAAFSPASDLILDAGGLDQIVGALRFTGRVTAIIVMCFLISLLYNVCGIGIAASGALSPLVSAILMPLSSVTVVTVACGATAWAERRSFGER